MKPTMKPWGSQVTVLHFLPPNLPAEQRRWLAGGPGGGNERPWSPHGCGEICGTDASPTADNHATPWGCTRLFELRHRGGDRVPAQVSRCAAPPIRSDILIGDTGMSPRDRPSCELTRQGPSTLTAGGSGKAGCTRRCSSRAQAGAASAAGPSRQGDRSRSIAQQRTRSLRARATIACFLRALPRLSRW